MFVVGDKNVLLQREKTMHYCGYMNVMCHWECVCWSIQVNNNAIKKDKSLPLDLERYYHILEQN